jgi:hypothetical protein
MTDAEGSRKLSWRGLSASQVPKQRWPTTTISSEVIRCVSLRLADCRHISIEGFNGKG